MKKLVAVMVLLCMTVCSLTAFASDNSNMEQVLRSVKERIGSTEEFDEFNSSESETGGEIRYRFSWQTSDRDNYKYIEISAGKNGIIYNYHYYDSTQNTDDSKIGIGKMSTDDAMLHAEVLMNKLNPQLENTLFLKGDSPVESLYGSDYSFAVIHTEKGNEIYGDGGYITYDAAADKIKSFYMDYTENPDCPPLDDAISSAEAKESFMKNFGLRLYYMRKTDKEGNAVYIPVYAPDTEANKYINALNGEVEEILTPVRNIYTSNNAAADKEMMADGTGAFREEGLTEAERDELEALGTLLSKNELIAKAKSNKYITVDDAFVLESYRLAAGSKYRNDEDKYYVSLNFAKEEDGAYIRTSFTLDAKNGDVISCSRYGDEDKNQKLDAAAAEKLAAEAAKTLSGKRFEEYKADERKETGSGDMYTYTRYVNGIPVDNDKINIRIGNDNKLRSYNITYSYNDFESLDGIISEEEAGGRLMGSDREGDYGLVDYIVVYMPQMSKPDLKEYDCFVPVYIFEEGEPTVIDAKSGKQLDYNGEEYVPFRVAAYNDIDYHYAQNAISELAKYGISFEGDSFRPDEKITQNDFMKLINAAFGNGGAEPYPAAKSRGIIKAEEINETAPVSRSMAAVFLIRGMGAEEYAGLEGIFVKPFEDVEENIGAISILKGMGVLSGDGTGRFKPNETITRADSAMMIYKYLVR